MQLQPEQFEKLVKQKLRDNQLLFFASIFIALLIFVLDQSLVLWSIGFLVISTFSLPNINRCKEDLMLFRKNRLETIRGKVLDVFLEKEGSTNWILFLDNENAKKEKEKIIEFVIPLKPEVEANQTITVHYSPRMFIPVLIQEEIHLEN